MNNQKPLIIVLCIVVAILGFTTISQQRQIESLRQDITVLKSDNEKAHRDMQSDIDYVKNDVDDLENKLVDVEGNVSDMELDRTFNKLWKY